MYKITGILLLAVFLIGGAIYYLGYGKTETTEFGNEVYENNQIQKPTNFTSTASYMCSENKTFSVSYADGLAQVAFSPSEKITLEQAVSSAGSKFLNEGGTFVFWSRGEDAFIEQNGMRTYSECMILTMSGGEIEIVEVALNQAISAKNVSITPFALLEDSRCAVDVVCIQAGTVRVRAKLESGLGEVNQIFKLGQTVTTESEEITLVRVLPANYSGKKISLQEYRFYFEIKKR